MKKIGIVTLCLFMILFSINAQRKMEKLDRGLVAVKVSNGVFVSWRMFGEEWYNVTYNLYRDGVKLNDSPLEVSNYSDTNGSLTSSYTVAAVINDVEQTQSDAVIPLSKQYLEIPMVTRPAGYEINDATAADLDGDGEYEIIVKRMIQDWSTEATMFTYFEAYKMDGTLMWDLNVGPNIMSSSGVEINIAAFDLDEDGKAEVFLRTSEGTVFGDGTKIGDTDNDGVTNYRYSVLQSDNMRYMNEGPEFLSLVEGETGVELDRVDFIPRGRSDDWGDGYGHRANKFFFGAPYLDGKKPSLFTGRGIYTKTIMRTYDVVNKKLQIRWQFTTENNPTYFGQGNHNYTIADVDEDGRDEIVWGGMTVDDDGTGLYSTQLGHGDAMHVGDLDPFRKGTEIWRCLENSPMYGTVLYDGASGDVLIHDVLGRDCGRCMAANTSDNIKGKTLWGSTTAFSASLKQPVNNGTGPVNFRIYWDGDLLEELLDHNWNGSGGEGKINKPNVGDIFVASGTNSCNWTKGTPTLQADLFGDWREEVIWRTSDDSKIRIYTTTDPTIYRNYTLMHDHQYRQAICWQMCGYNQPPHVSYFLGKGEDITVPPPPTITNERLVYTGGGIWDKTTSAWAKDGVSSVYTNGEHVHFDVANGEDVNLTLSETVMPSNVTVNSPGNYSIDASAGKLSGEMNLIKQGLGVFSLNGTHDYNGKTEVWTGEFAFNGSLTNSTVWVNRFAVISASGQLNQGLEMLFSSKLFIGGRSEFSNLEISGNLSLEEKAELVFDLRSTIDTPNDSLKINGDIVLANGAVIQIIPHLEDGEDRLAAGNYLLATVTGEINGDLDKVKIDGILGTPASLSIQNDSLILVIKSIRSASSVLWNGEISNVWDLANSANFLNNGVEDVFVTGDEVELNDSAYSKHVDIVEDVSPGSILVDNSAMIYSISGEGSISGSATLTKRGSGKLIINNNNTLTGKILVEDGTLQVAKLPNDLDDNSPIGPVSVIPYNFELNGGALSVTGETTMDRAMTIGSNGGTINNLNTVNWNGRITGGILSKTGSGTLIFGASNTNNSLYINGGAVRLLNEEAHPGNNVIFNNGTLFCYDNIYTYSSASYSLHVPEGKTGTMYLDGRCAYNNTLTGSGTLSIYIPYVRTDLNGNWSDFDGTININVTGDYPCRFNNSYGYPNAIVNVTSDVYAEHLSGSKVRIGSLEGSGTMGNAAWEIGSRNEDFIFRGSFTGGSLTKVGTGNMILFGASTFSSNINVVGGALIAINPTGSATGTGNVLVRDGAAFGGTGSISGGVIVYSGGTLHGGYPTLLGSSINVKSVTMNTGSNYSVNLNSETMKSDKAVVSGTFAANGNLILNNMSTSGYTAGQSFQIVSSPAISGMFESISPETPGEGLEWNLSEFNTSGIIKVDQSTGLDNLSIEELNLYPNPSDDFAYIDIPENAGEIIVQVETLDGKVINQKTYNDMSSIQLDLSGYKAGVYLVHASFNNRKATGRLIVK